MFFIQLMGRRNSSLTAKTLTRLGEIMTSEMANLSNGAIVVAVGKTDQAVMPYVWIRRNEEDKWEGDAGDCIKLGIENGSLIERDPISEIPMDGGVIRVMVAEPKEKKRSSNEDMNKEAERMVKDLFKSIREEE